MKIISKEAKPGTALRSLIISVLVKAGYCGPSYSLDDLSGYVSKFGDSINVRLYDMETTIGSGDKYYEEIKQMIGVINT